MSLVDDERPGEGGEIKNKSNVSILRNKQENARDALVKKETRNKKF